MVHMVIYTILWSTVAMGKNVEKWHKVIKTQQVKLVEVPPHKHGIEFSCCRPVQADRGYQQQYMFILLISRNE